MKSFQEFLDGILKLAIVGACIYAVVYWQYGDSPDADNRDYAEQACLDEIDSRFSAQSANVYAVAESDKGFVVRASVTLTSAKIAKVYCLTNEFGRVEEIRVEER